MEVQIPSSKIFPFASIIKDAFIFRFSVAFQLLIICKSFLACIPCHMQVYKMFYTLSVSSFFLSFLTGVKQINSNTVFPLTD